MEFLPKAGMHLVLIFVQPEWRNWQTRQVEGLVGLTSSAGSSPVSGIKETFTFPGLEMVNVPFQSPFPIPEAALTSEELWSYLDGLGGPAAALEGGGRSVQGVCGKTPAGLSEGRLTTQGMNPKSGYRFSDQTHAPANRQAASLIQRSWIRLRRPLSDAREHRSRAPYRA